jgi:type IV pilus assembly protein PilE
MRRQNQGITLIELMIAVAIVGILAVIAYPSYMSHVRTTHRSEIVVLINQAAQSMERGFSRVGNYTDKNAAPDPIGNQFYSLGVIRTATTFTLTAVPAAGKMMANDICGSFVLTNTGERSNINNTAATAKCWSR